MRAVSKAAIEFYSRVVQRYARAALTRQTLVRSQTREPKFYPRRPMDRAPGFDPDTVEVRILSGVPKE